MYKTLIYIHGFNSSPASFKARLLCDYIETHRSSKYARSHTAEYRFMAPALPVSPAAAMESLAELVEAHPQAVLVGSSLGGYFATHLAERYALNAVLINPAVQPYALLTDYIGRQENLYTHEEYDFTAGHVAELRGLETEAITPQRYLLMVTTGDEVLDYRAAVTKYRGARQLVIEGGNHGFSDFAFYLDQVFDFLQR